jgi:hypothetical protein
MFGCTPAPAPAPVQTENQPANVAGQEGGTVKSADQQPVSVQNAEDKAAAFVVSLKGHVYRNEKLPGNRGQMKRRESVGSYSAHGSRLQAADTNTSHVAADTHPSGSQKLPRLAVVSLAVRLRNLSRYGLGVRRRIGHAESGSRGRPMTEAEWLACEDPEPLLEFLRSSASERKLRLLGCARCDLSNPDPTNTAEAVRFADGLATLDELRAAWGVTDSMPWSWPERGYEWVRTALPARPNPAHRELDPDGFDRLVAFRENVLRALRDIFGNPFRPVAFAPAWRTDTAVTLARMMYESRDFSAMPILADALQDAGCDNDDVLNHCQGDGPHVRGCWVVDLILGKA